jgi:hypothetical protein
MRRLLLAWMLAVGATAHAADRELIEAVTPHFTIYDIYPRCALVARTQMDGTRRVLRHAL